MKKWYPLLIPVSVILLTLFVHGHTNETLDALASVLVWAYLCFVLVFSGIGFFSMFVVLIGLHASDNISVDQTVKNNVEKTSSQHKEKSKWKYWLITGCVMSSFIYTEWTNAAIAFLIAVLFILGSRLFTSLSMKYINEELL